MIRLISPENGATVSHKKEIMKAFEKNVEEYSKIVGWCSRADTGFGICTLPEPIRFVWEAGDGTGVFELSDTDDFSHIVYISGNTGSFDAYNLFLGRQYWWRAGDSETYTFFTEDSTPRWMFVDGTFNVRDIGGYTNIDGKRIRQGMLYRGCELDGIEDGIRITEKGKETLIGEMGIRFDLDLRGSGEYDPVSGGPLGPSVRYEDINSKIYGEFVDSKPEYLRMLEILSDPENYPVYAHCAIGSDRTGTFIALIYGLLRMDHEQVCEEFEMSSLCFPDGNRSRNEYEWEALENSLLKFGENFQDRCYNHALWCGASPDQIETIRRILIEQ